MARPHESKLQKKLRLQEEARKRRQRERKAREAVKAVKVGKADKGKIIFVSPAGKKLIPGKGRPGHPVYVTKTGKKWLLSSSDYKPRSVAKTIIPAKGNLKRASARLLESQRIITAKGKGTLRKPIGEKLNRGKLFNHGDNRITGRIERQAYHRQGWGFGPEDHLIKKMARSLKGTIESQAADRRFEIKIMFAVRLPDGTVRTIGPVSTTIEKADRISIMEGGMQNFVRHTVYKFLAVELARYDYVLAGSANHIRALKVNKGKKRSEWKNRFGKKWQSWESDVVSLEVLEWRIEQQKRT